MSAWTVKEAGPVEREALRAEEVRLFDPLSVTRSRWLLDENPAGPAVVHVAVTPEGRIAGSCAMFPWNVMVNGKRTTLAQYGRLWTHPEFQRQGVSVAIGRASQEAAAARGIPVVFGILGLAAARGLRKLGYSFDPGLQRRQAVLSPRFLSGRLPGFFDPLVRGGRAVLDLRLAGTKGAWRPVEDLPRLADAAWPDLLDRPGIHGVRDGAFVAWRYGPGSGTAYRHWGFPADAPRVFAVTVRLDTRERIVEIWGRADANEFTAAAARLVTRLAADRPWVVDWCPPESGAWGAIAARAGFIHRRTGVTLVRWFPGPRDATGILADHRAFELTDGDSDFV